MIIVTDLAVEVAGLRGVSLSVGPGEAVSVTGVNGAGKSTLLRCVCGLKRFDSGEISVLGRAPSADPAFWSEVAYAAEEPAWYPGLTVREHLALTALVHGVSSDVDDWLDRFGFMGPHRMADLELHRAGRRRARLPAAAAGTAGNREGTHRRVRRSIRCGSYRSGGLVCEALTAGIAPRWASTISAPCGGWSGPTGRSATWPRR